MQHGDNNHQQGKKGRENKISGLDLSLFTQHEISNLLRLRMELHPSNFSDDTINSVIQYFNRVSAGMEAFSNQHIQQVLLPLPDGNSRGGAV